MGAEPVYELAGRVRLRTHRKKKIGPVEGSDIDLRLADEQLCNDLRACWSIRGRGHGDRLDPAERLDNLAQAQIFGPEVMSPLRHAMGLVNRKTIDGGVSQARQNVVAKQPLGRDVEEAQRAVPKTAGDAPSLLDFGRRVEARRLDAELA